jgi:hypothetical protein
MNIDIEDIPNPLHPNQISEHAKVIVVTKGLDKYHIVVCTKYRGPVNVFGSEYTIGDIPRIPNTYIHRAHLVITTNYILTEFSVIKNRSGRHNTTNISFNDFLNLELESYIRCMIHGITDYEFMAVRYYIVSAISQITGEPISITRGICRSNRDGSLIKYIPMSVLKFNFVNARISRS